jgi:hypothetical protein
MGSNLWLLGEWWCSTWSWSNLCLFGGHFTTALRHHWPQKAKDSNPRPCTTPPLTPKSKRFEPTTMHYATMNPKKVKDSKPRPCTTPTLTPKCQIFEPTNMHYATIAPKRQRFEPTTMHYTTIDPQKSKIRTHDHALHHHWSQNVKYSNPRPCTTPPLTPKKSKIRTHDHALHHYWPPKSQRFEPQTMHYTTSPPPSHWFEPTTMHYTTIDPQKDEVSNPRPCTTPPLTPKSRRFEPKTMHYTTIDPQK